MVTSCKEISSLYTWQEIENLHMRIIFHMTANKGFSFSLRKSTRGNINVRQPQSSLTLPFSQDSCRSIQHQLIVRFSSLNAGLSNHHVLANMNCSANRPNRLSFPNNMQLPFAIIVGKCCDHIFTKIDSH